MALTVGNIYSFDNEHALIYNGFQLVIVAGQQIKIEARSGDPVACQFSLSGTIGPETLHGIAGNQVDLTVVYTELEDLLEQLVTAV